MQSSAATPSAYLKELPPERRKVVQAVRKVIKAALPAGFKEVMQYGMISYVVPLKTYPTGYLNDPKVPLPYISLAAQKNYFSVYLMGLYADPKRLSAFVEATARAGKTLNMGKSCVRFRKLERLALDALSDAVAAFSVEEVIDIYQNTRGKKH